MIDTSPQRKQHSSEQIFDQIAGRYDLLNQLLSGGIDRKWRNQFLKALPANQSELLALDLACGTADVPITLCRSPKIKHVTGIDLSKEMLKIGQTKVENLNLQQRITLQAGDGVTLDGLPDHHFDLVTISFGIRNFSSASQSLSSIHRVLKPGGQLLIMEFSLPENSLIRLPYLFYFRHLLPKLGNLLSGHGDAYTYLNQTVEGFPYGDDFLALMQQAGFAQLLATAQTFGIATLYCGRAV
ncbi:MAG: bifunctional demethylmenaquinone methyltransferase/2-methoxy-6-polyprenyl-1,4-benzoquinol methylase UbiE [Bdellovibrionales bacterium]|jgi:demethylmenaquinone methyltransferase / 2-methoxy-6-polyprenyl-1,4-benzoquinol methylase|nr:bifunctional demethylmenaquinone methyltransferase/2-methoxy-6-polyprenyl-1,4-benzoquinol methylase UbiE [Bdellovibrionales bacterium]MBT3525408.1 bifunctional demethylmenaquinone methyltransferase/2-methoxy-6-polyprenyl-1,4-benzoquinol methylase UbiE [Bdellovibrionales bacterium]MBT7766269.1 bifunctional demethylmenaquinone methyltransferase/2-methoxy-6-polyprenyl-1,4-benzoquinol methylase UbiE [Bdellovibrionales bacterium]